jgi:hypothetical protein
LKTKRNTLRLKEQQHIKRLAMAQTSINTAITHHQLLSLCEGSASFQAFEKNLNQIDVLKYREELFNQFCKAYLAVRPLYQVKAFRSLSGHFRHQALPSDTDCRGLFESKGGALHAYQVIYQPDIHKSLHFDLQNFSEQFSNAYGRLIITNVESVPLSFTSLNGNYAITRPDLMSLSRLEMSNITRWLRGESLIAQPPIPYPHQQEAINSLQQGFKQYDRLTLIMACGSGKSLIPLWVAEQAKYQRVIVFVPTLALLRQFFHGWLKAATNKNLACIAVCSDETTVQPAETETTRLREDLGFPVTTLEKTNISLYLPPINPPMSLNKL